MKKLLVLALSVLLMMGVVNAEDKAKVKVYMFEAGGCPYCEAEEKYLKGLDGYGETFELVKKELYVDHVDWKHGKDYEIGKKVAEAFNEAGFEDASYEGTPFVVISDLYAAASYSTDLEDFINAAYEEGDKDVISCVASGEKNCIRENSINTNSNKNSSSKGGIVIAIIGALALIGTIIYLVKNKTNDMEEIKEEKNEETKKEVKTTNKVTKKTTAKKTSKK